MTDRKEALTALLAKVKAGEPTRTAIEDLSISALDLTDETMSRAIDAGAAYQGSLDAAKALHDAVLPGWECGYDGSIAWVKLPRLRTSYRHDAMGGYTARSWLIAILKALIAQAEQNEANVNETAFR